MNHKALIIGAGRMGSGYGLTPESHYYVHAKTYMDLSSRVELVGFVEPDEKRAAFAQETWHLPTYYNIQSEVFVDLSPFTRLKGIWCEKPFVTTSNWDAWPKIQVNYCRRFDALHRELKTLLANATHKRLVVMAKKDVHTVCHLTDLARYWNVDHLDYVDTPNEPGAYALRYKLAGSWQELFFPKGGISGDGFMRVALTNLLDAVDANVELVSPPENAIESEAWANKILKG